MTDVIQVTNVSPSASTEQMKTLFGFLGKIDDLRLFPPDDSPLPVTSRVCFVKFHDPDSAVVAQHLTNTVFVDRALIVVPYAEGIIPDEAKALTLVAPANAVTGLLPGGGLLPTPNPLGQLGAVPLSALGGPTLDPTLAALTLPGANLNSQNQWNMEIQSLAADQLLKLMSTVDPKLNHVTAGLVSPSLKSDASNKDIEEAMKRVREAQSLISAAIEPGKFSDKKDDKSKKHSRSRSHSRRRRTPSSSRHRRSRSRSRRRSHSKSRSRRRSKSPRRRRTHSRERSRRTRSKSRDKKREEKEKKRSKTPPKSYSTSRRSRSTSRDRRRRKSRSPTRSPPKKIRSPKRKASRTPSPRRHKKEKKKDKDREKIRDERERSSSKKKKSKDKEKERERRSESEKDVKQVTRDYDEEEQGYDSEKDKREEYMVTESSPPQESEAAEERTIVDSVKDSKVNGDDHHEEDMDMSD